MTEEEIVSTPNEVVFFLRDLGRWLEWESNPTASDYAKEINRFVERHYDALMFKHDPTKR